MIKKIKNKINTDAIKLEEIKVVNITVEYETAYVRSLEKQIL